LAPDGEIGRIGSPPPTSFGPDATFRRERWVALAGLAIGLVLIGVAAVAFCCTVAALTIVVIYAQAGLDGLADIYEELRVDLLLKTRIGVLVIATLYVGTALATLVAARLKDGSDWAARLALARVGGRRMSIAAIVITTVAYGAAATLTMMLMRDSRPAVIGSTDIPLLAAISFNLVVLAPIAEELLFRGWLYTGLRRTLAFLPSFLITAAAFAAIHWDAAHHRVFLVLPLAVALGLLRELTGSIKPTIVLHATYNLVIVLITLLET
jgi:uncharacterized protein